MIVEANAVFYVLLRRATANQLCEIVTFNRFLKDLSANKLVKEPKDNPHVISPLIIA